MIKVSANISKKVPIPGTEYSSQQFGAALEIEVSDADKQDAIRERIRQLYTLLSDTINEQIAGATQAKQSASTSPAAQPANRTASASVRQPSNGNGGNGGAKATQAQQRAIYAIAKSQNVELAGVLAGYGVTDSSALSVKDASRLIDQLKGRK